MTAGFDLAAEAYDQNFTHSLIGKYQRKAVRKQLFKIISENKIKTVLELNCGTGEDAMWLSSLGLDVIATDVSAEMLRMASAKPGTQKLQKADFSVAHDIFKERKFDLIFSNFGGINCLSPKMLEQFFSNIGNIMDKHSRLVLVIMPESTLIEKLYFLLKGDVKSARRRKKPVLVNVDSALVETHYYNPSKLLTLSKPFICEGISPVAIFVPPSYLEPLAAKVRPLIKMASIVDRWLSSFGAFAKFSDHYLISFKKR